jgi:hypothetical protein
MDREKLHNVAGVPVVGLVLDKQRIPAVLEVSDVRPAQRVEIRTPSNPQASPAAGQVIAPGRYR